jgi:hypothetical protein
MRVVPASFCRVLFSTEAGPGGSRVGSGGGDGCKPAHGSDWPCAARLAVKLVAGACPAGSGPPPCGPRRARCARLRLLGVLHFEVEPGQPR